MAHKWPLTPLGDILTERRETPTDHDLASGSVRIIEKISFDSGRIHLRSGGSTKTGMILARPGDLVVSGINAAKGAIAIYDSNISEPVAATIHYGAYLPRRDRVDVRFLWWMLRSRFFRDLLLEYMPGGIKTELKAKRLLPVPVPLPPLAEQTRILARIEELSVQVDEARELRRKAAEQTAALLIATMRHYAEQFEASGTLGDILSANPRNGWSARCDNSETGTPVLSLSAITGFRYRRTEFKRTSLHASEAGHFWLNSGDLLISRSNTPELVGHAAIYDGSPAPCIYPDLMMRLQLKPSTAELRFVWYWLQSPPARDFIRAHAKGTSPTMKKISQGVVMKIPFPVSLPIIQQRRVVAELDALQGDVDALTRLQSETAAAIDALLPSVLDRAFAGEL